MAFTVKPWDAATVLTYDETIAEYLSLAFQEGDPAMIAVAIGNVASVARATNLSRDTIYAAFSPEGNPTLSTLLAVTKALGFELTVKAAPAG